MCAVRFEHIVHFYNGWVLSHWSDPVGPIWSFFFAGRRQKDRPDRVRPTKNSANVTFSRQTAPNKAISDSTTCVNMISHISLCNNFAFLAPRNWTECQVNFNSWLQPSVHYVLRTIHIMLLKSHKSKKSDAIEGVPERLLKRAAMVWGYTVDMLNCCWATNVHSQWWL